MGFIFEVKNLCFYLVLFLSEEKVGDWKSVLLRFEQVERKELVTNHYSVKPTILILKVTELLGILTDLNLSSVNGENLGGLHFFCKKEGTGGVQAVRDFLLVWYHGNCTVVSGDVS